MTEPLFSVATPTRNALQHLRRCVGSVRGQTSVTLEHLVQDARSSDGTAAWLQDLAANCTQLRPVTEADSGMYDAINRAWSRASGRYLSWLNADEQYLPGTLNRVQAAFAAHPQAEVLFANYLVVDDAGLAVAMRREIPLRRFLVVNTFLNAYSCTLFFRRSLLDRGLLKLDTSLRYAADMDLVLRLLQHGVRFQHVDEVWSLFGIDGSNLSTHPGAVLETERVARLHGAMAFKPLRGFAQLARRGERLFVGAYRKQNFVYQFAVNEVPEYVSYSARDLGGRYSLAKPQGRAEPLTPAAFAAVQRGDLK